jgi:hypothetical protein
MAEPRELTSILGVLLGEGVEFVLVGGAGGGGSGGDRPRCLPIRLT